MEWGVPWWVKKKNKSSSAEGGGKTKKDPLYDSWRGGGKSSKEVFQKVKKDFSLETGGGDY